MCKVSERSGDGNRRKVEFPIFGGFCPTYGPKRKFPKMKILIRYMGSPCMRNKRYLTQKKVLLCYLLIYETYGTGLRSLSSILMESSTDKVEKTVLP